MECRLFPIPRLFLLALIAPSSSTGAHEEDCSRPGSFSCWALCAAVVTVLCCCSAFWVARSGLSSMTNMEKPEQQKTAPDDKKKACGCSCSCGYANGTANGDVPAVREAAKEREQPGTSMMEQLVPEITTHALSYLDYPSLCRLSMTNSSMRKAANDDNAWKALYHKDFTVEQYNITPPNGWKSYYAATKAVVNVNAGFYNIIRERSLEAMGRLWLRADYVKCIHGSGELFAGYDAVIESWALAFNWHQGVAFHIRDVRVRVLPDMAWVTMKAYVDVDSGPFNVTNIYEFHNGQWFMVHHHSSVMLTDPMVDHLIFG
ncbi:F-box protein [Nymphaea thermarum]|nr:F-box protein [Nymphaea thermarum]